MGDRFARRPLIATGYGMAALGKLIVAAAGAWPAVLVGQVVDRLGKGLRGAPRDALLVDGIQRAERGRVFGFHRTMDTLGAVIGPLLALAGYELFHHQIGPVLDLAVIPAALSVLLIAWVRERPRDMPHAARSSTLAGTRRPSALAAEHPRIRPRCRTCCRTAESRFRAGRIQCRRTIGESFGTLCGP